MNLQGQQIKNTYEGVLNIGSAGLSGSLVTITDGAGNPLPIQVSDTTVNFTGIVTGLTGAAGSSGTSGTSGINGSSGTSGAAGANGSSGTSGVSGTNGSSGTSGAAGANGSSGTSGVSGTNGSSGTSGAAGANGSSGTSGIDGSSGTSGAAGANGSSGTSGAAGANGSSGTSGVSGTNGSSGTSGVAGANGSSGTSGAAGANGSSGTSGANGSSGTSGVSGTNGSSGTSGVSGTNGSSGTSGVAGANGSSGTSGVNGSSGTSGAAGANGSSGTSGANGSSGTSGSDGSSGTSGVSGSSGTSGVNGATGPAGSGGATISSPGNTRLLTSDGTTGGIDAQANLTFTGTVLGVTGQAATYLNNIGSVSGTATVNFNNSNTQSLTLTGSTTLTFSNPVIGAVYNLKVVQGGAGSYTITWPGSVSWLGSAPTLQTAPGSVDVFSFIYDGTNYIGASARASMGSSGTSGISGSSGTSGIDGSSGTSGAAGANGSSGTSGADGSSGTSGANGSSGTSGVSGSSGTSGVSGSSGTSGAAGANGSSGTSGSQGPTGPIGPTGAGSAITSPGNNRVITSDGTSTGLVGEANFTFDGTVLGVTGQAATYLYDNGSFTGTGTVNFNNSNVQSLTLTGNTTLSFTNPTSGGIYTLKVIQGALGGYNITWPVSVIFIDGVPTLQSTVGAADFISVMYDGANYYASKAGTPQGLVYVSATQAVLAATGATANINIAISPKGNGAFSLQVPDGTIAGGNARGLYAVDLITRRDFGADRVASGQDAFAVGWNARANGEHASAVGGFNPWANGYGSVTLGGDSAYAGANGSTAIGGNGPAANGSGSVAFGFISQANGLNSISWASCQADGDFSMAAGQAVKTSIMGQFSRGYYIADRGDSQTSIITVAKRADLPPSTPVKLTTDPTTASTSTAFGLVMVGDNRTWAVNYQLNYVCTVSGGGANDPVVGDTYTEQGTFLAKKVAGTVTVTPPIDYTVVHDPYYTGGKIPVLTTVPVGSEVQFYVASGATTNNNTYRIIATLTISETAW